MAAEHCVILQYHHFSATTPRSTSVTPEELEAHLAHLEEGDFRVLPLDEVVDRLRDGSPLPERCVAITVDDAYRSVYTTAFPRLRARGWPFTVFVSTAVVDQGLRGYLSWAEMREMRAAGVSFGNHSRSHAHLIRHRRGEDEATWRARTRGDIQTAQERIQAELRVVPRHFAYPYGEYDQALEGVVGALGLVGLGQQSGPAWSGSDFLALPRFPMAAEYAALPGFRVKVRTLPLPVVTESPREALLPVTEWRPTLTLTLAPGRYPHERLQCYVSGQGRGEVRWLEGPGQRLTVRARGPLPVGRSRYNCTLPSSEPGRYRWYSHAWIRRRADGGWYPE